MQVTRIRQETQPIEISRRSADDTLSPVCQQPMTMAQAIDYVTRFEVEHETAFVIAQADRTVGILSRKEGT